MLKQVEPDVNVVVDPEIFNEVYLPLLEDMTPLQILFGGSSSGKSVFEAQRCVLDLMAGGRNYLVCREVAATIATSVRNEVIKVINSMGVRELFTIPKSDFTITCINGYQILFAGLDDVEKLKSITPAIGVLTDIWIEEATETTRDNIKLLEKRLRGGDDSTAKRITLTFNPVLQTSWIYSEYFKTINWMNDQKQVRLPGLSITKTTYRDNRFLTQQDIDRLENETDKYYYDVYTNGSWGMLGSIIFTNWKVQDLSSMLDQFTTHKNGGDFGFGGAPAAVSISHYDSNHKIIYIYDELYEKGWTNDVLADRTVKKIANQPIVWDSAEPKSIAELRNHGVNALHAKKGPDSVNFGIGWLKQQSIVIDSKCVNHRNEFASYKWKEDRKTGETLDEPVDRDNHLIDALRYAYEDLMMVRGKARSYEG